MRTRILRIALIITLWIGVGCTAIPAETQPHPAQVIHGELVVMMADDFKAGTARTLYRLIAEPDGAMVTLIFQQAPPDPALRTGMRIEIQGHRNEDTVTVLSVRTISDESP